MSSSAQLTLCPLCMMKVQSVCIDAHPSSESIQQAMVNAWLQGLYAGMRMPDKTGRLLNSCCDAHKPEIEVALLRQRLD